MPILVKDFSWRQTEDFIIIRLPFRGENKKNIDIITAENYVKASYQPYLFELFLSKAIEETESTCILSDNELIFNLVKEEKGHWDVLENELTKMEKKELRERIQENNALKYNQIAKEKSEKKAELNRKAVRHQINLDDKCRKKIEEIKTNERQKMAKEINDLKAVSSGTKSQNYVKVKEPASQMVPKKTSKEQGKQYDKTPQLAAPRKPASIKVNFTPREFITPKRESKAAEEDEWLRKQAESRQMAGFDDCDLTLEERDPVWLKEKGDSFFQVGNYVGAIAAYSHGIKINNKMAALHSNRAAAHIALGNFIKALEDSTMALELNNPKTPSNAIARARCHAKRGAAFWKLGMLNKGLVELTAAHELVKYYEKESDYLNTLEEDIKKLSLQLEENCDDDESDSDLVIK